MTQLVSQLFGLLRVADRNLSPIKQDNWSKEAYGYTDNRTIRQQNVGTTGKTGQCKNGTTDKRTTGQHDHRTTGQMNKVEACDLRKISHEIHNYKL